MRKQSKKTPEYMPPPTEINLITGVINMRGFDVDAWTTEQALLTSLKSHISLAVTGAQTAYRVHNPNCHLGPYVFGEALLTMSDRADIGHKWFSNYIVHDIVLYANTVMATGEEVDNRTLPELVAACFPAEQVIAAKTSIYIGKTGAMVITANDGANGHPSYMRITYNNNMFAEMRFVEQDMLPVITPKSGAILLNGALVQAKNGFDSFGQVPVPCTEFDGAYVLPEVHYFDLPAIVMVTFNGNKLGRVKITVEKSLPELHMWRERVFGETDEKEANTFNYRIDTTDGYTARIQFYVHKAEILYEFEPTQRT